MKSIKEFIKRTIGLKNLGRYDYYTKPALKNLWGGAFNGQEFRRQIFHELIAKIGFEQIIETGAFRGNTTEYMAATGMPILSVEFEERVFGYVTARLRKNKNVRVYQNDSRLFLAQCGLDDNITDKNTFFYLDAHWSEDLPLAQELELVLRHWPNAVVMIDDFCVPNTQYQYDDYGPGKALTLDYINKIETMPEPYFFFPTIDAEQETGMQRGCVVLTWDREKNEALRSLETLAPYSRSGKS